MGEAKKKHYDIMKKMLQETNSFGVHNKRSNSRGRKWLYSMGIFNSRSWVTFTTSLNTGDEKEGYSGNEEVYIVPGKNENYFLFGKWQAVYSPGVMFSKSLATLKDKCLVLSHSHHLQGKKWMFKKLKK